MNTQEVIQEKITNRLTIEANKVEGGFAQDIIQDVAYEFANVREIELTGLIERAFVKTAQGNDLDNLGANYEIPRREARLTYLLLPLHRLVKKKRQERR